MIPVPGEVGGVRGRWVKVRRARRLELIEATAEVFAEHGYENSGISLLASTADVTKATLYAHFKDKSRLFEAVLGHWLDSLPDPILLPANEAGLHDQLTAVERDLHQPASKGLIRAVARSVYAPETCLGRWHRRLDLHLRHLEEGLSRSDGCENPKQAAYQFLNLVLCDIDRRDATKFERLPADLGIAEIFVRAYGSYGCACGCVS